MRRLILFFSFFYTSIVFNPEETAENLKKNTGRRLPPAIRPGKKKRPVHRLYAHPKSR